MRNTAHPLNASSSNATVCDGLLASGGYKERLSPSPPLLKFIALILADYPRDRWLRWMIANVKTLSPAKSEVRRCCKTTAWLSPWPGPSVFTAERSLSCYLVTGNPNIFNARAASVSLRVSHTGFERKSSRVSESINQPGLEFGAAAGACKMVDDADSV